MDSLSTQVDTAQRATSPEEDQHFHLLRERMQARLQQLDSEAIFRTSATKHDLWAAYLSGIPADLRQYHNCSCCRHFLYRYGGLATVGAEGQLIPLLWQTDVRHGLYEDSVQNLAKLVQRSTIVRPFYTSEQELGHASAGGWTHLSVRTTPRLMSAPSLRFARTSEAEAAKVEDRRTVLYALGEFSLQNLETAVTILQIGALPMAERFLAPAQWLLTLKQLAIRKSIDRNKREALIWKAIAEAPEGFCHPRSGVIDTLLEDILAGKDASTIQRAFAAKVAPLAYQRPKAAPTAGAVQVAENLVERLGITKSLERRYARFEEVKEHCIWLPEEAPKQAGGVFGHLKPKAQESDGLDLSLRTMSWMVFLRDILPQTKELAILTSNSPMNFHAILTAEHADAPPILQWDNVEKRNPFSWYLRVNGAQPRDWELEPLHWHKVTGVLPLPCRWQPGFDHMTEGQIFLIDGCRDTNAGTARLFPATLKSALHGIRATIEAYSKSATTGGRAEASACGIGIQAGGDKFGFNLKATLSGGIVARILLDRWE